MPYTVPWDESSPDGAITPAADIDVELQDLKTSLRERLEQVIPDFGNDLVDPKVIPSTVIDNSTAFCWAVYFASVSNQIIPNTGVATQVPLALGISVPGANPWTVDGGNIVYPDDGSYVLIATCSMQLEAPAKSLLGMKTLTLPGGPSQHNDAAQFQITHGDADADVIFTGSAISIVKEAAAGDKAQAYSTAWDIGGILVTGIAKVTGMTIFALRIGA